MSREPPYTLDILRLAASLPLDQKLDEPDGVAEARSATCGSTLQSFVKVDDGRIAALAQNVTACAYGQASAALLHGWAPSRLKAEVIVMRAALRSWLEGRGEVPAEFSVLLPVQARPGRHGAILLPFDALLAALDDAHRRQSEAAAEPGA